MTPVFDKSGSLKSIRFTKTERKQIADTCGLLGAVAQFDPGSKLVTADVLPGLKCVLKQIDDDGVFTPGSVSVIDKPEMLSPGSESAKKK